LNDTSDAFKLDLAGEKIPVDYGTGDYWQIDTNDNTTYQKDV